MEFLMPPVRRNSPATGPAAPHLAAALPHPPSGPPGPQGVAPYNTTGHSQAQSRSRQHQLLVETKAQRAASVQRTTQLKMIAHWQAHAHEHDPRVLIHPEIRTAYARTAEQLIDWVSAPHPRPLVLSRWHVTHLPQQLLRYAQHVRLHNMPYLQSLEMPALENQQDEPHVVSITSCNSLKSVRLQQMENADVYIEQCRVIEDFCAPKSLAKCINIHCCQSETPKKIDFSHLRATHTELDTMEFDGYSANIIPPTRLRSYTTPSSYHFDHQGKIMLHVLSNRLLGLMDGEIVCHPSTRPEYRPTHADILFAGRSLHAIMALQAIGEFDDVFPKTARERVATWRRFFGPELRKALGKEFVDAEIGRRSYLRGTQPQVWRSKLDQLQAEPDFEKNLAEFLLQWPPVQRIKEELRQEIKSSVEDVFAKYEVPYLDNRIFDIDDDIAIIEHWISKDRFAPTGPPPLPPDTSAWSLTAPPSGTGQQSW
jgi:hypothetical protein